MSPDAAQTDGGVIVLGPIS